MSFESLGYRANHISCYFVNVIDRSAGDSITHLKVQKLVYYAQGWHLALFKKALFEEDLQAWAHGPIAPSLWRKYKKHSWEALPRERLMKKIKPEVKEFLQQIYDVFGCETAKQLEQRTHSELPWRQAHKGYAPIGCCNEVISKQSMYDYFSSIA